MTAAGVAAVLCAALAAALLAGRPQLLRDRLGRAQPGAHAGAQPAGPPGARPGAVPGARAEARAGARPGPRAGAGPGAWPAGGPPAPGLRAPAVVLWVRERARRRREQDQREADVAEVCVALSAELKSGVPVGHALAAVGHDWPDLLGSAAARAAIGGDVVAALRDEARRPGAGALEAIAASWEVSEHTGAPLSQVLMAVADSLRTAATVRREAASQLATARTTARLMAVLPFGTLLLLSGDGSAVRFLLTTPYGLACLAAAGAFVTAGLWWVRRVARSVLRPAWEP